MTLRLDMLKAASKASDLLGESASHCTRFLLDQQNPNGGFRGRSVLSDLYYTVFGGEALVALNGHTSDSELVRHYLTPFQQGRDLDLVHLACLGRCWATVLDRMAQKRVPSLVYVNNHYAGHAPSTVRRLQDLFAGTREAAG